MRILVNSLVSHRGHGGAVRLSLGAARSLCAAGHDVTTAIARDFLSEYQVPGTVRRIWPAAKSVTARMLWEQIQLPLAIVCQGFDAILCAGTMPAYMPVPGVLTLAETLFLDPATRRECRDGRYRFQMIERSLKMARVVTVPTDAHRERLMAAFPEIPGGRYAVLPPYVDDAFFAVADSGDRREPVRLRYGLPMQYVLHVGPLTPRNNPGHIVQGLFAAGMAAGLPHHLVMVGYGHDTRSLVRFIREHGMEGRVRLLPSVAEGDLPQVLAMADAFVKPARAAGWGGGLLEAMACGVPVIASDLAEYRALCGTAAELVPWGDLPALRKALEGVLGTASRRKQLRDRGFAQAQRYRFDRFSKCMADIVSAL